MAGGLIGGAIGGIIGFFIGGPSGAYLGASIGAGLGLALFDVSSSISAGTPQNTQTNTATQGGAIPDVLGTSKISGNIIWEGNTRAVQVATTGGGKKGGAKGGSKSTANTTTEYNYYKSWALSICQGPVDNLLTIWNEDTCVWSGRLVRPSSGSGVSITLTNMGAATFYFGSATQAVDGLLPGGVAYRHTCYAVMNDCLLGNMDRVPSLRFVVRKIPAVAALTTSQAVGAYDYNAAHAIYYILNTHLGLPTSMIDATTFETVAAALNGESLGISVLMDSLRSAQDIMTDILTHVGGLVRYDFSGKFCFALLRIGAAVASLPQVDETMITEEPTLERNSWLATTNQLKITYPLRSESGTLNDATVWDYQLINCSMAMTVSSDQLTATRNRAVVGYTTGWAGVRANKGKSTGKWYFEIHVQGAWWDDRGWTIGLATAAADLSAYVGSDAHGWGYYGDYDKHPSQGGRRGPVRHNGLTLTYGNGGYGITVQVAVDLDLGVAWIGSIGEGWINGGDPIAGTNPTITGLSGTMYPMAALYNAGASVVINCGQNTLAGTIPDGFQPWTYYTGSLNYENSTYTLQDSANMDIVERISSENLSLSYFQAVACVGAAADRLLKKKAYPAAVISFKANRDLFRLQPGDLFSFNYAPWAISNLAARVTRIQEDDLASEALTFEACEAVEYLSGIMDALSYWKAAGQGEGPKSDAEELDKSVSALTHVLNLEAPYALAGENIEVLAMAGREVLREIGFGFNMSIDNVSYQSLGQVWKFAIHGTLDAAYSADTYQIDDEIGFYVTFDNTDVELLNTLTRAEVLSGQNLAIIGGTEIVAVQTFTPVSGYQYKLTGIFRGLLDTEKIDHAAGEDFWFLGADFFGLIGNAQFLLYTTRYFKDVPFSALVVGDISEAAAESLTFAGRAFKPYTPGGFQCNGCGNHGFYSTDCVLAWSPRLRTGLGAGLQSELTPDAAPTWEGLFEVEMWEPGLNGSRTGHTDNINAVTTTMTPTLGGSVVFRLRNKITTGGITYASGWVTINVEKS